MSPTANGHMHSEQYPAREHSLKLVDNLLGLLSDEERTRPQIIFLQSAPTPYRNDTDRELPHRQESSFFYLSGCAIPNSSLLISYLPPTVTPPTPANLICTLFIPPEDPLETLWSLPPPSIEQAEVQYDVGAVKPTPVLEFLIRDLMGAATAPPSPPILHVLPLSELFPPLPQCVLDLEPTTTYLLPALHLTRITKSPAEIDLIRKANAVSSRAHEVVMRLLGKYAREPVKGEKGSGGVELPGEWRIEKEGDAEAVFVASCRREGAVHQAYLPIVASSTRAATLHYCCNDKAFAWGPLFPTSNGHANGFAHPDPERYLEAQVLLIDAGCEWQNYASDITRTMPLGNGGKFTPEARAIYSIVLLMQKEAIASLRPGLHWDAVQLQCHKTLVREFLKLGIFVGHEEEVLKSGVSAAFFPHGVGHSLGLDVHDVPSASRPTKASLPAESAENPSFYTYLRLRLPLAAGMVLTVEPGIYFSPHQLAPVRASPYIAHDVLKKYEPVGGVRIEDVLVITESGCENLTVVGKDVEWVEGVCSGEIV